MSESKQKLVYLTAGFICALIVICAISFPLWFVCSKTENADRENAVQTQAVVTNHTVQ